MKNLLKLLLAVVALAAVSCTTDATNDLGVQVSGDGQTTITLSLEKSRTQLGEEVNGLYPLYWSAGDKISVNGVESGEAMIDSANPANAGFTIGSATAPYRIAYPAAADNQVIFAAEQEHASNTSFGSGVSTMYGYSTSGVGVELHHLTGILKIGITGNATLTHAQISTVDRKPIAGVFGIDFESGDLTATAASKEVISYSIPASEADGIYGLELTSEPQYIHIAVPAGEYNELYVTLYDNAGGVMYATVKANDEKPLAAGKIRTFAPIAYAANDTIFVISDYESLKKFAAEIGTLTKDAVFVADIDIPADEEWVSINNSTYVNTIHGHGYAIKGLTKPLFDTTAASIKGLHLKDVKIVENKIPTIGAMARFINSTTAVLKECSAVGSITINATEFEATSAITAWAGGLFGRVLTTTEMSGLYTDVDIYVDAAATFSCRFAMGGCFGSSECSVSNSVNHGTLKFEGTTGSQCTVFGGGICFECKEMTNCVNGSKDDSTGATGSIEIGGYSGGAIAMGGLADMNKGNITNCHNYGNLISSAVKVKNNNFFIGGLIRMSNQNREIISNCTNHGDILVKNISEGYVKAGGFLSKDNFGAEFVDCTNYGNFTADKTTAGSYINYGGFIADCEANTTSEDYYIHFTNCNNYGNVNFNGNQADAARIGGLIATIKNTALTTCTNCHNYGALSFNGKCGGYVYMGGLIASLGVTTNSPVFKDCTNNGTITVSESASLGAESDFGGLVGMFNGNSTTLSHPTFNNCANNATGDILIASKSESRVKVNVGGCIGRLGNSYAKIDLSGATINRGDITVSGDFKEVGIGGIFGFFLHQFGTVKGSTDMINYGKITFSGSTSGGRCLIGGVIGANDAVLNSGGGVNPINLGDIEFTGTIDTSKTNYIGGLVGLLAAGGRLSYSQCFCNIKALGLPNVGIVTGTPRATSLYTTNCKAGGTITNTYEDILDAGGVPVGKTALTITVNSENYFDHMYGTPVTKDVADGDKFVLYTSADQITYRGTQAQ